MLLFDFVSVDLQTFWLKIRPVETDQTTDGVKLKHFSPRPLNAFAVKWIWFWFNV